MVARSLSCNAAMTFGPAALVTEDRPCHSASSW